MSFKIFETLDKYERRFNNHIKRINGNLITEADEEGMEEEGAEGEEGMEDDMEEGVEGDPTMPQEETAPEDNADVDSGTFMSDIQKADIAKTLLDAFMSPPPAPGMIPQNMLNVTADNADQVMGLIQNLISLQNNLSTENDSSADSMASELKSVGNS